MNTDEIIDAPPEKKKPSPLVRGLLLLLLGGVATIILLPASPHGCSHGATHSHQLQNAARLAEIERAANSTTSPVSNDDPNTCTP